MSTSGELVPLMDQTEVDSIREHANVTLNEVCTINMRTTENSGTGPIETITPRAENVPARRATLGERTALEPIRSGQTREQELIVVSLLIDQETEATDQIVFADRSYEVINIVTNPIGFLKRVVCKME